MTLQMRLLVLLVLALNVGCSDRQPTQAGPYVRFVAPNDGQSVSDTIQFRLDVNLPEPVERFEFGVAGQELGAFAEALPQLEFDTSRLVNGPQRFIARVTTDSGEQFEDVVEFVVQNAPHRLEWYRPLRQSYAKGETATLELRYTDSGLALDADFSELDTAFAAKKVVARDLGLGKYELSYPISSANSADDAVHNVYVTATDKSGQVTHSKLRLRLQTLPTIPISVSGAIFVDSPFPDSVAVDAGAPQITELAAPEYLTSGLASPMTVRWQTDGLPAKRLIVAAQNYHGYFVLPLVAQSATVNLSLPSQAPGSSVTLTPVTLLVRAVDSQNQGVGTWRHSVIPNFLKPAGARIYLTWDSPMDLDLEVLAPNGTTINYESPSADGGTLDLDSNTLCSIDNRNTEVISWPEGEVPVGEFTLNVSAFGACGQARTNFKVVAEACGKTQEFAGTFLASEADASSNQRQVGKFVIDCARRVHGTIGYLADLHNFPAAELPIRALTGDSGAPTVLAEGTTGPAGEFNLYLPPTGYDEYRVEVNARWTNPRTGKPMLWVSPKDSDSVYYLATTAIDAKSHPDQFSDLWFDVEHGSGILNMIDSARRAYEWVEGHMPLDMVDRVGPIGIRWEVNKFAGTWNELGSYYDGSNINIGGNAANRDDIDRSAVAHEFMHHVTYSMTKWSVGGTHYLDQRINPSLAYNEGLATALAQQALGDPEYRDNQANGAYFSLDLEDRTQSQADVTKGNDRGVDGNVVGGKVSEILVAALLWDLMDAKGFSSKEAHDQVDSSYWATLSAFSHYVATEAGGDRGADGPDLVDFIDGWRCYSPGVPQAKLEALLNERQFTYEYANAICATRTD